MDKIGNGMLSCDVWDYKTDKGLTVNRRMTTLLCFGGMTAAFGAIQLKSGYNLWLAIVLFVISATLLSLGFAMLYTRTYYKMYVGDEGFYLQTTRKNGRYYKYTEIKDCYTDYKLYMRISDNALIAHFYFTTYNGVERKFRFDDLLHRKAVATLDERIKSSKTLKKSKRTPMQYSTENEIWEYEIDGRKGSVLRLTITAIISAVFISFAVWQYIKAGALTIPTLMLGVGCLTSLSIFISLLVRFIFFKVKIGVNGFYLRTGIAKGKYYEYRQLSSAEIVAMSGARGAGTFHYFSFTDNNGLTRQFQIDPSSFTDELAQLKKRIDA